LIGRGLGDIVRASMRRIAELQKSLFDERDSLSITGRTSPVGIACRVAERRVA
jgi:hypothetical protein